jgi:antitoxin ChpS
MPLNEVVVARHLERQSGWRNDRRLAVSRTVAQEDEAAYSTGSHFSSAEAATCMNRRAMLYSHMTAQEVDMYITNLRKVGGSVMLAVPPAILDLLELRAGERVGVTVDGKRLVVEPAPRPRYSLDALLAQCDPSAEMTAEDRGWLDAPPTGNELL